MFKKIYNHFMPSLNKQAEKVFALREKIGNSRSRLLRAYYIYKYNALCIRSNCFIPLGVRFKSRPVLPHGIAGIFISANSIIGEKATIFQNVIIGSNNLSDSKGKGSPQIGDDVLIGAGATVIGNCRIGNHVRIGANTTVTSDVPDNCVVIGATNRYIHKDGMDNTFHKAKVLK